MVCRNWQTLPSAIDMTTRQLDGKPLSGTKIQYEQICSSKATLLAHLPQEVEEKKSNEKEADKELV